MNVTLTPTELRQAAEAGVLRRIRAMCKRRAAVYGEPEQELWGLDIEAAAAEMAVAKGLGIYWSADCALDYGGDVGEIHVRHTRRADGGLIVYPRDLDEGRFVLVIGSRGEYTLSGWILGFEAKQPEFHANGRLRTDAFLVPQDALLPIEALEKMRAKR